MLFFSSPNLVCLLFFILYLYFTIPYVLKWFSVEHFVYSAFIIIIIIISIIFREPTSWRQNLRVGLYSWRGEMTKYHKWVQRYWQGFIFIRTWGEASLPHLELDETTNLEVSHLSSE